MAEMKSQASRPMGPKTTSKTVKIAGILIAVTVFVLFAFVLQPSEALSQQALNCIAVFLTFVIVSIFGVTNMTVIGPVCIALLVLTKTYTINEVLATGFGSNTVWFIIFAFALTTAINKTGLFARVVAKIMTWLPETWNAQVVAFLISGFIINPFIPSGNAKVSIFAPMAEAAANQYGLKPHSKAATGLWLGCWQQIAFQTNAWATSTGFVICAAMSGESYSFVTWMGITGVWLFLMTGMWLIYVLKVYKPEAGTKFEKGVAKKNYEALGPMKKEEKIGFVILLVTLVLWIFGTQIGIDNTTAAIIGFSLTMIFGLFNPQRDFATAVPWSLMLSMFCLMPIFAGINTFGISAYIITILEPVKDIVGNPVVLIIATCIIVYLIRQLVVDTSGSVIICTTLFGGLAASQGLPVAAVSFSAFVCTSIYNNKVLSLPYLTVNAATKGWIEFEDIKKTAWPYAIMQIVALVISIPVWRMMV